MTYFSKVVAYEVIHVSGMCSAPKWWSICKILL